MAWAGLLAERLDAASDAAAAADDARREDGTDAATRGALTHAALLELPEGLDAMLLACFREAFAEPGSWARARPVVAAVVAAREPLPVELAAGALRLKPRDLQRATRALARLFPVARGRFVARHAAVVDFLTWPEGRHDFTLDADAVAAADARLADYAATLLGPLLDEGEVLRGGRDAIEAEDDLVRYALRHFAAHARRARRAAPEDVARGERVLGSLRFLCASAKHGRVPALVRELAALADHGWDSAALREVKRWLLCANQPVSWDVPTKL